MRTLIARTTLIAAGVVLATSTASAQLGGVNPLGFGISAGASIPTGEFGKDVNTGYNVNGIVTLRVPVSPISFRGEVGYDRFDVKSKALDVGDKGNARLISGVANVVLSFPSTPTSIVRPYLIGGVGAYNVRGSVTSGNVTYSSDSQTKFGFNVGGGLEIPLSGFTAFGEVRYTRVSSEGNGDKDLPYNATFVPIRFGVRF